MLIVREPLRVVQSVHRELFFSHPNVGMEVEANHMVEERV